MCEQFKLYSHIMKVKGKKNWVLEDLLRSRLYKIEPGGNLEELEQTLLKKKLIYKSKGIKLQEFRVFPKNYNEFAKLRNLVTRITPDCESDCRNCGELCSCFKGGDRITDKILNAIINQSRNLEIDHLSITGGNPLLRPDILEQIRTQIKAKRYTIVFKDVKTKKINEAAGKIGYFTRPYFNMNREIRETNMKVNVFTFFYNKEFNPCWGNSVAVDTNGDIKPCLWADKKIGNVEKDHIKELILLGKFEESWKLKKDDLETCKECEYRYACTDCRVAALNKTGSLHAKTPFCNYNPAVAKWT